jgi:hypothetical protein
MKPESVVSNNQLSGNPSEKEALGRFLEKMINGGSVCADADTAKFTVT